MGNWLSVKGADNLARLGPELRNAGRGVRPKLRRNLIAAAQPVKKKAQSNAASIPAVGASGSTGLRAAIANSITIKVGTGARTAVVRVWVNPKRMPPNQRDLPWLMENGGWTHPLFGIPGKSYPQASHPYMAPVQGAAFIAAQRAAIAVVNETAAEIERG